MPDDDRLDDWWQEPSGPASTTPGDVVRLRDGRVGKVVEVHWIGRSWEAHCDTDRGMECHLDSEVAVVTDQDSVAAAADLRGPLHPPG